MENIVKTFPGVIANRGINLEVRRGEVHALLGENGAGKTVLMSVLYGLYTPDSGEIYLNGEAVSIKSPKDALGHRIGMVHQHFMLEPTLTVTENIILGQFSPFTVLNQKRMEEVQKRIQTISNEFGLDIDPAAYVSTLSVGEQQWVEILKVLYHGADLLILDEPTAVLTPQETSRLLKFLRELVNKGLTAIFITHKLEEVMQVSDRVTVLRDGQVIGTCETKDTNPRELAKMMVGRDVLMDVHRQPSNPGDPVLEVRNLRVKDTRGLAAVKGVSFTVRAGEIVGIAGVSGNGQTELALAITGLIDNIEYDEIRLGGKRLIKKELLTLNHLRTAHIPEDRQKMGIILPFSVAENFIVEEYREPQFSRRGFLRSRVIREHSLNLINKYTIRASNVNDEIANLSGGNQQKVVVARELERHPRFLLVNQPTRGIDVGATEFVHEQILEQRDAGTAILLISTDLEEIFALSDRILVIFEGEIIGELPSDRSQLEKVGLLMAGKRD
jgi:ABC-type uncharacterized transport system ATPase subunit